MSDRDDLDRLADDLRGLRPRPVSATVRARLVSRLNEPRRLHSAWVGRSVVALAASAAFVAVLSTLQVEEPPAPAERPKRPTVVNVGFGSCGQCPRPRGPHLGRGPTGSLDRRPKSVVRS